MTDTTEFDRAFEYFEREVIDPDAIDIKGPEFSEIRELSYAISSKLRPIRSRFLDACLGKPYDGIPSSTLSFPDRFLGGTQLRKSSAERLIRLRALITMCFDVGFLSHIACTDFPTRNRFDSIDVEDLFERWAPQSLASDVLSRDYDQGNDRIPSAVFEAWYRQNFEPIAKSELNLGWWKRAKATSWFRNVFFAGCRLGLLQDLATKNLSDPG